MKRSAPWLVGFLALTFAVAILGCGGGSSGPSDRAAKKPPPEPPPEQDYTFYDLGEGVAFGVNETDVVVGSTATSGGSRAFTWSVGGGMQVIEELPYDDTDPDPANHAQCFMSGGLGINDAGHIAGQLRRPNPYYPDVDPDRPDASRAGLWDGSWHVRELPLHEPDPDCPDENRNWENVWTCAINNNDEILGVALGINDMRSACHWDASGAITFLRDGGSYAEPSDINDAGMMVGSGSGARVWLDPDSLPDLLPLPEGASYSRGEGINQAGWVAGQASFRGRTGVDSVPAIWAPDPQTLDAPKPYTYFEARALNNEPNLQVVGYMSKSKGGLTYDCRAFLWDEANGTRDLNGMVDTGGRVLTKALDVNDHGTIVGATEEGHGYVLVRQ